MLELFYMGGPLFMGILTLIFICMISVSVINGLAVFRGGKDMELAFRKIDYIKSVGLFALVIGVLGQLIGLYSAFRAIETVGDVSPAMVAGGFRVSMITTLYGFVIYAFSLLIWFGLSSFLKRR